MDSETESIKEHLHKVPKSRILHKLRVSMGRAYSDVLEFEKVTKTLQEIIKMVLDKSQLFVDQPAAVPTLSKKFKETYPGLFDSDNEILSKIRLELAITYAKQYSRSLKAYDRRKIRMKIQKLETAPRIERLPRKSAKKSLTQAKIDPPSTKTTPLKELTPQAGTEFSTTPARSITYIGQLPHHFAVFSNKPRKPSRVLKDGEDWQQKYVSTAEEGTAFRMFERPDELDSIPFDVQNYQRDGSDTESRCLSANVLNGVRDVNFLAVETGLCLPTFDSSQMGNAAAGDVDFGSEQAVRKVNLAELKRPGQVSVPLGITRSAQPKRANPPLPMTSVLISQEEEESSFSASLSHGCKAVSSKNTLTPLVVKPSLISTSPLQRTDGPSARRGSHGSSLTSYTTQEETSSRTASSTYIIGRTPEKAGDFLYSFLQSCQVRSMIRLYDVLSQVGITEEYAREMGKSWTLSQIEDFLRKVFASSKAKANGLPVTEIDITFLAHRFCNYFREGSKKEEFSG